MESHVVEANAHVSGTAEPERSSRGAAFLTNVAESDPLGLRADDGEFDPRHPGSGAEADEEGEAEEEHEGSQESSTLDVETSDGDYDDGPPVLPDGTRFFLMRAEDKDHIDQCKKDGIWVTSKHNESTLTDVFKKSRCTILIFAANGSEMFEGYAKMETIPGATVSHPPEWARHLRSETSKPFRVLWFCKYPVDYAQLEHIQNPLNALSCVRGIDGTEYSDACGREMIRRIEELYEAKRADFDPPFPRD